ncbi:GntR family transcriptional regulator [Nitratireductor sp.]|uniref:GntR family transcriptional regulator n=1 Tax=Nitratireductor sp. TaxID=1872084 RepID=UPI002625C9B2|nr:GntR family transcriptional regulator [Nitratireductor sp.]MCV0381192.1 GntR family transcriptional regulator [Nitratireductor sp.]
MNSVLEVGMLEIEVKGLSQDAYEKIAAMILSGELKGGAVLNDRRLSDSLGISRTPVREAMGRLEGEGYLVRSGRTTIVSKIDLQDILQIISARILIEGETARLAAEKIDEMCLQAMREAVEALLRNEDASSDEHWSADDLVHLGIAEAAGNIYLAQIVANLRKRTRIFGMKRIPSRFEPGIREHLAIIDALHRRDAHAASRLMSEHIASARDGIINSFVG